MDEKEIQHRIDLLEDAKDLIREAVDNIREAVKGTSQADAAHSYVIPSLKMCIGKDHDYLGSQPFNCDELIENLQNNEDEDDEDEDS